MKNNKIEVVITGEKGKVRCLSLQRNTIRNAAITGLLVILLLVFGAIRGIWLQQRNWQLQTELLQLTTKVQKGTEGLNSKLQVSKNRLHRQLVHARNELARVIREKKELNSSYKQELETLKRDQEALLEGSISKLAEQSKVIENVIDQLGVKVEEDPGHSGGPYIAMDEKDQDRLIFSTDRYLTVLQQMPLGAPVHSSISSRFGRRIDPINHKRAFHSGIDFRGRTGDDVRATGNGVVKKSGRNKGLGNYIILSHGNGYETKFGHLSKRLVKKGQKIIRGQVIGLIGNTGRSTGSHLHYEIRQYGKAVNPMKYLKVSDLTVVASR